MIGVPSKLFERKSESAAGALQGAEERRCDRRRQPRGRGVGPEVRVHPAERPRLREQVGDEVLDLAVVVVDGQQAWPPRIAV